ncbi:hypothetical protein Z043-111005 [Arapaima gigas]
MSIRWEKNITLGEPPGFLHSWWCVFWDLYCAAPDRRETCEHSSEAKAFHDYKLSGSLGHFLKVIFNPSIVPEVPAGVQACISVIIFRPRIPLERQLDGVATAALLITVPFPGVSAAQKEKNNQVPQVSISS